MFMLGVTENSSLAVLLISSQWRGFMPGSQTRTSRASSSSKDFCLLEEELAAPRRVLSTRPFFSRTFETLSELRTELARLTGGSFGVDLR